MAELKGVSPDAEIVTNEQGGKQSKVSYGFHLMDAGAILALAEVLQYGASRYVRDNWRKIPSEEHFNHMMIHYYAWLSGDTSDDHLGHVFCRAMMLHATAKAEEVAKLQSDKTPYDTYLEEMGEEDVSEPEPAIFGKTIPCNTDENCGAGGSGTSEPVRGKTVEVVNTRYPYDKHCVAFNEPEPVEGKYDGLSNGELTRDLCSATKHDCANCPISRRQNGKKFDCTEFVMFHSEEFRKIAIPYLDGWRGKYE